MNVNLLRFVLFFAALSTSLHAQENPWQEIMERCNESPLGCKGPTELFVNSEQERKYAVSIGCIKAEHLEFLRQKQAVPLCDSENRPFAIILEG